MKTLIRFFLSLIVSWQLLSCSPQIPVSRVTPENNKTYQVDFLFEHDGCKVYRFYDHGNPVYFTNCNGDIISIESDSTRKQTINIIRNNSIK
jgi:hypothetical protein